MWKTMGQLEQMIHISKALDQKLEEKANELDATEPAKAKAIRETALFYTRQRTTDLLTQMAVTVQGYLALDLVKKNNVELIKGVDRASTTTVSALRTAVTVAQAMTNQRLVLDQITALNTTTANVIDSTGELLKSQTGEIHRQAASSTIPLETLQRAFQNIYDTMDTIDRFKVEALGSMKQTVDTLTERGREEPRLHRPRRGRRAEPAGRPQRRLRCCSARSRAERDGANAPQRRGGDRPVRRIFGAARRRMCRRRRARGGAITGGRRARSRGASATMGMAIAALIVATIGFGLIVGPIGWTGLFLVALADPRHPAPLLLLADRAEAGRL